MTNIRKQRGFSAIIAVVLIVLFTLIGAYMATMSSISTMTTSITSGSIQAWFAAKSGAEWGIHQALNVGTCTGNMTINGFNVAVSCPAPAVVTENPNTYNVFTINSVASRGTVGDIYYVTRSISIKVTDAP